MRDSSGMPSFMPLARRNPRTQSLAKIRIRSSSSERKKRELPGSPWRPDRPRNWLSIRRASCRSLPTICSPPSSRTLSPRISGGRLFSAQYFYSAANRYNLYEGPVAWTVRAARMLCPPLATAAAVTPIPTFPVWKAMVAPYFADAGQDLLDPAGPNGWKEHDGWINSNTMRYRGKFAASLALGEIYTGTQMLFPTTVASWFPTAPATAVAVYDRLVALLQPAPIPTSVRDTWLSGLWTSFTWDTSSATQQKVRELVYLILCSPYAQLH